MKGIITQQTPVECHHWTLESSIEKNQIVRMNKHVWKELWGISFHGSPRYFHRKVVDVWWSVVYNIASIFIHHRPLRSQSRSTKELLCHRTLSLWCKAFYYFHGTLESLWNDSSFCKCDGNLFFVGFRCHLSQRKVHRTLGKKSRICSRSLIGIIEVEICCTFSYFHDINFLMNCFVLGSVI